MTRNLDEQMLRADGDENCPHDAKITLMFGETECLECGRVDLVVE